MLGGFGGKARFQSNCCSDSVAEHSSLSKTEHVTLLPPPLHILKEQCNHFWHFLNNIQLLSHNLYMLAWQDLKKKKNLAVSGPVCWFSGTETGFNHGPRVKRVEIRALSIRPALHHQNRSIIRLPAPWWTCSGILFQHCSDHHGLAAQSLVVLTIKCLSKRSRKQQQLQSSWKVSVLVKDL